MSALSEEKRRREPTRRPDPSSPFFPSLSLPRSSFLTFVNTFLPLFVSSYDSRSSHRPFASRHRLSPSPFRSSAAAFPHTSSHSPSIPIQLHIKYRFSSPLGLWPSTPPHGNRDPSPTRVAPRSSRLSPFTHHPLSRDHCSEADVPRLRSPPSTILANPPPLAPNPTGEGE